MHYPAHEAIARYREGKRISKAFTDLAAAKKEAHYVAQRIQSGMQHVTDKKSHERDRYVAAMRLNAEFCGTSKAGAIFAPCQ